MTTCYLAASFSRRAEIRACAMNLRRAGVTVTSRWHDVHDDTPSDAGLSHAKQQTIAQMDRADLEEAHVLVLFGSPPGAYEGQGGMFVELGMALAMEMHIVVIGFRSSIFEHLPEIVFAPNWDAALAYVRGLHVGSDGKVTA